MKSVVYTNCRTELGITVGLIDSLITIARVLSRRDLSPVEVREALTDLRSDEDISHVFFGAPIHSIKGELR